MVLKTMEESTYFAADVLMLKPKLGLELLPNILIAMISMQGVFEAIARNTDSCYRRRYRQQCLDVQSRVKTWHEIAPIELEYELQN
jgi:hypothetical protein